jgi:hypothetical protein
MDSRAALSCPTQEGLPGSSTDLSPRAAPNHPEESGQVLALCFPTGVRLPPHGGTGHSLLANEAESDSLYAAAHGFAAVRLRRPWISPSSAHRATCRKSNYMVDSFHSTRSASLILAHPCAACGSFTRWCVLGSCRASIWEPSARIAPASSTDYGPGMHMELSQELASGIIRAKWHRSTS